MAFTTVIQKTPSTNIDFIGFTQEVCGVVAPPLSTAICKKIQEVFDQIASKAHTETTSISCTFGQLKHFEFIYKICPTETKAFLRIEKTLGGLKKIFQEIYLIPRNRGILCSKKISPTASSESWSYGTYIELLCQRMLKSAPYLIEDTPRISNKHPFTIRALECPWFEGSTLHEFLYTATPEKRLQLAKPIAKHLSEAIADIHKKKIVHSDLKTLNILICATSSTVTIKVIDFANALFFNQPITRPHTTREYTPPEEWTLPITALPSIDIWAFGLILTELFFGMTANKYLFSPLVQTRPLESYSQQIFFPAIMRDWEVVQQDILTQISTSGHPLSALLLKMLSKNPEERPSASAISAQISQTVF